MRHTLFACDFDGTIATNGVVAAATREALERLRQSGWKLVLVTGRELDELRRILPEIAIFDRVVAENGGVIFDPATSGIRLLTTPSSAVLAEHLEQEGVPFQRGRTIIATREPHDRAVAAGIEQFHLDLVIIHNKGAVMVLPPGIDKRSGIGAAALELAIPLEQAVGVGDAENDLDLIRACGLGAAVGNAVDALKEEAEVVTTARSGAGTVELIDLLLSGRVGQASEVPAAPSA